MTALRGAWDWDEEPSMTLAALRKGVVMEEK